MTGPSLPPGLFLKMPAGQPWPATRHDGGNSFATLHHSRATNTMAIGGSYLSRRLSCLYLSSGESK